MFKTLIVATLATLAMAQRPYGYAYPPPGAYAGPPGPPGAFAGNLPAFCESLNVPTRRLPTYVASN
jgi:hypothetical protein